MTQETQQLLKRILDGIEITWLENLAMRHLLGLYNVPNWTALMIEFCNRDASKAHVRSRFVAVRTLIEAGSSDFEALEALAKSLRATGRTN